MDKKTTARFERIEKDLAETNRLTKETAKQIQNLNGTVNRLAKGFLAGMKALAKAQAQTDKELKELSRTVDRFIRYRNGHERN